MAYDLTAATTNVRYILNESTAAFWSDAEIQAWIKEGVIDLSSKLLCVTDSDTITLVEDQYVYNSGDHAWIGDCIKPKFAWYVDATVGPIGMQKIEPFQFGHEQTADTGAIKYYYYDSTSRDMYILPVPDSTAAADTVGVIYSKETDDITALKDEYQILIFTYAAFKARLKERLYSDASFLWQQYMNCVNWELNKQQFGIESSEQFEIP